MVLQSWFRVLEHSERPCPRTHWNDLGIYSVLQPCQEIDRFPDMPGEVRPPLVHIVIFSDKWRGFFSALWR